MLGAPATVWLRGDEAENRSGQHTLPQERRRNSDRAFRDQVYSAARGDHAFESRENAARQCLTGAV